MPLYFEKSGLILQTHTWEQRKLSSLSELFTDEDWIESKDQSKPGVRLI